MDWTIIGPICGALGVAFVLFDRVRRSGKEEAAKEADTADIRRRLDAIEAKLVRLDEDKVSRTELAALGDRIRDRVSGHVARLLLPGRIVGPPSE